MTDETHLGLGLRLLAIVQLVAFHSLYRDVLGFAGSRGLQLTPRLGATVAARPAERRGSVFRMDLIREFEAILTALEAAGVEHAICGGFAVNIHGHVRATKDVDLLLTRESVPTALAALAPIGFDIDAGTMPFDPGTPRAREVRRVTRVDETEVLTVDLLIVTPVFDEVWRTRERLTWRGRSLCVVSIDGLAVMKRLAGRHQDLADLEQLGVNGGSDDRG